MTVEPTKLGLGCGLEVTWERTLWLCTVHMSSAHLRSHPWQRQGGQGSAGAAAYCCSVATPQGRRRRRYGVGSGGFGADWRLPSAAPIGCRGPQPEGRRRGLPRTRVRPGPGRWAAPPSEWLSPKTGREMVFHSVHQNLLIQGTCILALWC